MKITLKEVTVRELVDGFEDNGEEGVRGYGGQLDIRPPYQRAFIYDNKEQQAVIDTVMKDFPLNTMYWVKKDDGTYEVMDGQQRTMSICNFYKNIFSVNHQIYNGLPIDKKRDFLDYPLFIYVCEGEESEKLDWFETINIAGKPLTDQELRNAIYSGPFVSDAKRYFSKRNGPGYRYSKDYVKANTVRQELLEKAIAWKNDGKVKEYMMLHQDDRNSHELIQYFESVLSWVKLLFPNARKNMQTTEWGYLYNEYGQNTADYDADEFEQRIVALHKDDEVENKKGIYRYLFDGKERHLSLRDFTPSERETMYEQQEGICPHCKDHFDIAFMHADHITPWSRGGKTTLENGQMLCADCNRRKSNI